LQGFYSYGLAWTKLQFWSKFALIKKGKRPAKLGNIRGMAARRFRINYLSIGNPMAAAFL
jgi:hypothetical protein